MKILNNINTFTIKNSFGKQNQKNIKENSNKQNNSSTISKTNMPTRKSFVGVNGIEFWAIEGSKEQNGRLFVKCEGKFYPYNHFLNIYNKKDELISQILYHDGYKSQEDIYENGCLVQSFDYGDIYNNSKFKTHRTSINKYVNSKDPKAKKEFYFGISRNCDNKWIKQPKIEMKTKKNDFITVIKAEIPTKEEMGIFKISSSNGFICRESCLHADTNGAYKIYEDNSPKYLLEGLKELKETITSQEYQTEFGNNEKFNSELDKAMDFLASKINEC